MHPPTKSVVLLFLVLVCFISSFHFTEGKTIVRIKKPRRHLEPQHIQSLVKLNHGVYARSFAYEEPSASFSIKKRVGRNLRKKNKAKKKLGSSQWQGGLKTYARKYKTWSPSKDFITANHIVFDAGEKRPHKKRRRPAPIIIDEDLIQATSKKRRVRPNRINHLRRPNPPSEPDVIYDEYDGDYFPEETKRQEIDYEIVDDRFRPRKKKRRPSLSGKKKTKKPEVRYPFDDDSLIPDGRYKPALGEPSVSYSNFIQHPNPVREIDYDYPEEDESRYIRTESRKKRKRVKKKSSSRDRKREKNNYRQAESEEDVRVAGYVSDVDRYPPIYPVSEEPEYPKRSNKQKRNKLRYESTSPIYGDGHISSQNSIETSSRYPNTFARPEFDQSVRNYIPPQNSIVPAQSSPYNPTYSSRPVQQQNTFSQPIYENNFDNQINVNRYNQITSRPYQQNSPVFSPVDYTSQNNQYQPNSFTTSSNFNGYAPNNGYSNQISSGSYQQPVFTRNPVSNSVATPTFQNGFKSSPAVFDNTESFYDFNNNANVNSQQSKNALSTNDYLQKYSSSNRLNTVIPSRDADADSEFIAKHQNLYNNGLTGVPVQGDGFGSNRNQGKTKDYDIGYGEFQFDENPTS